MKKALLSTVLFLLLFITATAQIKLHNNGHVSLADLTTDYGIQVSPTGYTFLRTKINTQDSWANYSVANASQQKHWIVADRYSINNTGTHKFYVYGNGSVFGTGYYNSASNPRGGSEPITGEDAIRMIREISGYYFEENPMVSPDELENNEYVLPEAVPSMIEDLSKRTVGFVADNLDEVFPDAVRTDAEGKKYINYQAVTTILVEAVKKQQTEIEQLRTTLKEQGFLK